MTSTLNANSASRSWPSILAYLVMLLVSGPILSGSALGQLNHEREPINYSKSVPTDRIARLQGELSSGAVKLQWEPKHGYLKSLLDLLEISSDTQTLVFSKTSLQASKISPQNPRAIYFSDDVYLGWVPNGELIEMAAMDAKLGTVFYTVKQKPDRPELKREVGRCMTCHASTHTQRVPGLMIRSVYCDASGEPLMKFGSFVTHEASPLIERWGGWYVTGQHGRQRHLGNQWVVDDGKARVQELNSADQLPIDVHARANRVELKDLFETQSFLTSHSDIVALMILEHQTRMHNALTAACHAGRLTERESARFNEAFGREHDFVSESTERRYAEAAQDLVEALLMPNSIELTDPIIGSSEFTSRFQSLGPWDTHGRSLRQLDLSTRLFRYPCSYLIYSDAYKQLPLGVRSRTEKLLREILHGVQADSFPNLTSTNRRELLEILEDTGVL
jgi:hypothetical protein